VDEEGARYSWKVASWIIVALTLILNIVIVGVIVVNRNANSVVNKALLTLGIVDLIYGIFVSPFFIENYVNTDWEQGLGYCRFFIYIFTFHDLFIPLVLILLSSYVSLTFAGATDAFRNYKRQIYIGLFVLVLLFSIFLAIPATVYSHIVLIQKDTDELDPNFREECRSKDEYTMVLTYFLGSSLLFCFTMSFLFSLCIVGSPLLRDVMNDKHAFRQRWHLLLTLSLINSFYIVSGFLLNFQEISRFLYDCCNIKEPFTGINNWKLTYHIWSFVLLIAEPFLRPLASISFYFKYLYSDPLSDTY